MKGGLVDKGSRNLIGDRSCEATPVKAGLQVSARVDIVKSDDALSGEDLPKRPVKRDRSGDGLHVLKNVL